MEQVHQAFVAAGGTGSDAALAIERGRGSATAHRGRLVPARPPEPLAGIPDRSPIPLADSVAGGLAAVSTGASRARSAIGNAVTRLLDRAQDLLPRANPLPARHAGSQPTRIPAPRRLRRPRVRRSRRDPRPGLVDPRRLGRHDSDPADQCRRAGARNGPGRRPAGLRQRDRPDRGRSATSRRAAQGRHRQGGRRHDRRGPDRDAGPGAPAGGCRAGPPLRSRGGRPAGGLLVRRPEAGLRPRRAVRGPDGAPYVLDRTTKTVYRIGLQARKAVPIIKAGQTVVGAGVKVGVPRYLAVGGPDLLVLDDKNILWRWRPADATGKGTLRRLPVQEGRPGAPTSWPSGPSSPTSTPPCTTCTSWTRRSSRSCVIRCSPTGSSYPAAATGYLSSPQDVSKVTSMYIDGDVYLADGGVIERFVGGSAAAGRSPRRA